MAGHDHAPRLLFNIICRLLRPCHGVELDVERQYCPSLGRSVSPSSFVCAPDLYHPGSSANTLKILPRSDIHPNKFAVLGNVAGTEQGGCES